MIKVVIDTNVLISAIGLKSPNRVIFDKIKSGAINLIISNEILNEYNEIFATKMTPSIAGNIVKYFQFSDYVIKTDIYFNWELINDDYSDNKFVDCYLASSADFLVTNDKHFNKLKSIDFPKVNLLSSSKFIDFLIKQKI